MIRRIKTTKNNLKVDVTQIITQYNYSQPQSQDRKTLKKPTKQRLKRSPRKQQKKATINWRTRPQRKNLTNPPRPKQSPTRKAMTKKFSLSKRRSPNCKENCKVNLIQRRQ
ncbi:Hypothetical_protein [Hexamita inflata]|uniref:Hypothetical_protein n=1 Tax=Hexamita inflata TaxID=28002 RepID=A0AA86Q4V4_9EUKA|nr:Hypothetical protein HINF_LOCUS33757 [Hexamita inflata]